MDDETRAELIEKTEAFRAVDETVKTVGWQKFILPRCDNLRQAYQRQLLDATEPPKIIRAQESIKAIDMLIEDIDLCIEEGKEAIETLAKEKE